MFSISAADGSTGKATMPGSVQVILEPLHLQEAGQARTKLLKASIVPSSANSRLATVFLRLGQQHLGDKEAIVSSPQLHTPDRERLPNRIIIKQKTRGADPTSRVWLCIRCQSGIIRRL
ncbi:hypothetical protein chiPu_0026262 [Chiloscyllium punctatum]|uniref:Uncharacterized protein n=1 Tax=Chiloscyllium punctatum TaxID=137246 RepID=A0A401THW9_CHIPU|nr:hypothetical protein [Chiloscyllium punctatum]